MRFMKVSPKFWTDEKTFNLDIPTKLFAIYLLTSPHSNSLGLYYLPKEYAAADLGWNAEEVEKALKKLIEIGFCHYDRGTRIVFLPNFLKYHSFQNMNQVKGAVATLDEIPNTYLLKMLLKTAENISDEILEPLKNSLQERVKQFGNGFETPEETVPKRLANGSETVPEQFPNGSETVSEYIDIDIDKDIDIDIDKEREEKENLPDFSHEKSPPTPYMKIVELFHEKCPSLPRVVKLTEERKKYLRARWKEYPNLEFWENFFERIEASNFLTGRADYKGREPFIAGFTWILRPRNFVEILEGKYDNDRRKKHDEDIDFSGFTRRLINR